MSIEQAILDAVPNLPFDKQHDILAHAQHLRDQATPKHPFQSVKGILPGGGISISADDSTKLGAKCGRAHPEIHHRYKLHKA